MHSPYLNSDALVPLLRVMVESYKANGEFFPLTGLKTDSSVRT